MICWMRSTLEAKVVTMIRLLAVLEKLVEGLAPTLRSLSLWPGCSTLVESGSRASTPSLPSAPRRAQVRHAAGDGRDVELEVAGVDNGAHRGLDGEGHRVGDGVVDVDEFHGEAARLDRRARLHGRELRLLEQAVLLQLQLHERRR